MVNCTASDKALRQALLALENDIQQAKCVLKECEAKKAALLALVGKAPSKRGRKPKSTETVAKKRGRKPKAVAVEAKKRSPKPKQKATSQKKVKPTKVDAAVKAPKGGWKGPIMELLAKAGEALGATDIAKALSTKGANIMPTLRKMVDDGQIIKGDGKKYSVK